MVGEEIRQSPRSYEFGHGGPFPHYSRHMCVYTHIWLVIILLGYSSPLAHIHPSRPALRLSDDLYALLAGKRKSRGCTQTETQRSVVGLLVHVPADHNRA
jgi:hypothetical protein